MNALLSDLGVATRSALRALKSTLGRLATGLATLAALAVMLWPKKDWHLEPDKLAAFLLALLAWVAASLPDETASAHDTQLFAKLQALVTPGVVTWLYRHDFGGSFAVRHVDPFFEIDSKWEGAAFSFDDQVLRSQFEALLAEMVAFASLIAVNTWPIGDKRQTAVPDGEYSIVVNPQVQERIAKLNAASSALANSIDAFVVTARKRLPHAASPNNSD